MTFFPDHRFDDAAIFFDAYADQVSKAQASVDRDAIRNAADLLVGAVGRGSMLYSCGNGGSAAISNHLLCDCLKGAANGSTIRPRVYSLSSSAELMSAIVNDIGVEDVFSLPLQSLGVADDVLIAISSSGASPNIIRALETAVDKGMRTIAMTGFDGGRAKHIADVSLHVDAENYGVIEDVHQSLMHMLAQYLRMGAMADPLCLGQVRF